MNCKPLHYLSLLTIIFSLSLSLSLADDSDAFSMSLEELMEVEVFSAGRKAQEQKDIPAAVFVIDHNAIKRSGATNIPELLRMAPGVNVLSISNNKWAISIRGGVREYANKLLVLVDGRSVYSPTFSGVFWEGLDIPLELINRIEIIRGPGASIWGANAVNGVINIITKSAKQALGAKHVFIAGDQHKASAFLSHGWQIDPQTHIRAHIKGLNFGPSEQPGMQRGEDSLKKFFGGFRLDKKRKNYKFMLKANLYKTSADDQATVFSEPPFVEDKLFTQNLQGINVTARWVLQQQNGKETTIQTSLENSFLEHVFLSEKRTTFDFDVNQRSKPHKRHDLIIGLGGRISGDKLIGSPHFKFDKKKHLTSQFRLYINDEILLQPAKWKLFLSAMLEHNEYTGLEFQPSLRLSYQPGRNERLWLAISRAVRTPARSERGARINLFADPAAKPLPILLLTELSNLESEEVTAIDLGWRKQLAKNLSLDLTGFYNRYRDLAGAETLGSQLMPGYIISHRSFNNEVAAEIRGIEGTMSWRANQKLQLEGSYSFINIDPAKPANVNYSDVNKNVPARSASFRALYDISRRWQFDNWLLYRSNIETGNLPGFVSLDSRLAYNVNERMNFSIVCQNLFDKKHKDFFPTILFSKTREMGRKFYAKLEWSFD